MSLTWDIFTSGMLTVNEFAITKVNYVVSLLYFIFTSDDADFKCVQLLKLSIECHYYDILLHLAMLTVINVYNWWS